MRRLRKENAELREEMQKLRKRNAEIDAMGEVFQGDVLAQVLEFSLKTQKETLQKQFNDNLGFDHFCQLYDEYIDKHLKNEKYPSFEVYDWEFFWKNADYDADNPLDFTDTFAEQINRCRWCGMVGEWDEDYNCPSCLESENNWKWINLGYIDSDFLDDSTSEKEEEEEAGAPPTPSPLPATKRTYKCSVCGITGHNKTTCPQKK